MCTVNSCCGFLSLDAGTKTISILFTISSVCILAVYGPIATLNDTLPPARVYFYASLAVLAVLEIGIGGILIRGAFHRKPQYTLPWIILAWGKGVTLILLTFAGAVMLGISGSLQHTADIAPVIAGYFIYAVLLLYFAMVVNSRRLELVLENYWAEKHVLRHTKSQYYYI